MPVLLTENKTRQLHGRFVYVNSGTLAGERLAMDARAKVPLGGITWSLIRKAAA